MLSKLRPLIENRLQGLIKYLKWVSPNTLTLLGIIPQVLFFVLMSSHHFAWAAVALLGTSLDMLDGLVARATNRVTKFGGFFDSTLDRVSDFFIIAGFYAGELVRLEIAAVLLVATFLISYTRSRAELASDNTIKFNHGPIERPERIAFFFIALLTHLLFPDASTYGITLSEILILVLTALSIYTVFRRIWMAYKKL